ncbi:MAG: NAD-dependent epimerase/dehydratase family protein [Micromonosporaceae bacterium]
MRVLVAGATGVIGRQLMPLLTAVGHEVTGLSRSPGNDRQGQWVTADALDRTGLEKAVREAAPDAVVNLLTAIPGAIDPRHLAGDFALTNRLRTEGTRNLLDAALAVGAQRIIAEGLAYAYDPSGDAVKNEDAPLWRRPPKQFRPVLDALKDLEGQTAAADGLVLRFGHLYGPGSAYASDGAFIRQIRAGKFPVAGKGTAVFSFTHAHDAATAIAAALDRGGSGVLNVVDDTPAPLHEWLPAVAKLAGGPQPKRVPAALARMAAGGWGVAFLTELRGADNARARLRLDWRPRFASWREGFAVEFGGDRASAA